MGMSMLNPLVPLGLNGALHCTSMISLCKVGAALDATDSTGHECGFFQHLCSRSLDWGCKERSWAWGEWFLSCSCRLQTLPAEDGPNCYHRQLPKLTGWMRNRQTLDLYCGDSRVFLWEKRLWPLHLLLRACLAFIVTVAEISISTGPRHLQKMRRPVHQCTESIIKASAGFRVWLLEMGLPYSDFNCVQHKIQIKLLLKCPGAK